MATYYSPLVETIARRESNWTKDPDTKNHAWYITPVKPTRTLHASKKGAS